MEEKSNKNNKATLVITYNSVKDYPAGEYQGKNSPIVIYSHENSIFTWGKKEAEERLGQILHKIFGRIDPEDIEQIYLYAGLYAKNGALRAAKSLTSNKNNLTLVACDCEAREKSIKAKEIGVQIIWADCGGRETLKRIVEQEMA